LIFIVWYWQFASADDDDEFAQNFSALNSANRDPKLCV